MSTKPGEGERRAVSGYRSQYLIGAHEILQKLQQGDLEWIRVADPDAGRVDDLQVGTSARVDAYQVKWTQYGGTTTLNDLTKGTDQEPSLIAQLSDGWERLRRLYPKCRVVVHLVTNTNPSPSFGASMPKVVKKPSMKAIAPSKPRMLPKKSPTASENGAQLVPNLKLYRQPRGHANANVEHVEL
jgi:hypothetical protein